MARRSRGADALRPAELEQFLVAAAALHEACCRPFLRTRTAHYNALSDLNQAIRVAIIKVTGEEPQWAQVKAAMSVTRDVG